MAKQGSKKKDNPHPKGELLCGKVWQLTEVYDSYVKRRSKISGSDARRTFLFKEDGSFKEEQFEKRGYEGEWLFTAGERKIKLLYTKEQQVKIEVRISQLTSQRLKIVWPGRCGSFIETYEPRTE